jgi:hypothetical protein
MYGVLGVGIPSFGKYFVFFFSKILMGAEMRRSGDYDVS